MSLFKQDITDETLAEMIRNGDKQIFTVLLDRYLPLIHSQTVRFYGAGLESDDLMQEGTLALYIAATTFDPAKSVPFSSYACTCVHNRVLTVYRNACARKHLPLNSSISLSGIDQMSFQDSPETEIIARENCSFIAEQLKKLLSGFEYKILSLYLCGFSYDKISSTVGVSFKSVDNALQRIRRKLKRAVESI